MKAIFQKIGAVLLTLVVMFSTMSFTLSKHYCGGEMVAWSILSETAGCGMEADLPVQDEDCSTLKTNCCLNLTTQIEGQVDLKIAIFDLKFQPELVACTYLQADDQSFEGLKRFFVPFDGYPPPLIVQDIQVLYEVFII